MVFDPYGGHVLPPHEFWASAANSPLPLNSRCVKFFGLVSFLRPMQFIRIRKVVSVQVCVLTPIFYWTLDVSGFLVWCRFRDRCSSSKFEKLFQFKCVCVCLLCVCMCVCVCLVRTFELFNGYCSMYISSATQGSGGSFKVGNLQERLIVFDCCESEMPEQTLWLTERCLELCILEWLQLSPCPPLLDVMWHSL